jgi:hypothetical protein
MDDNVSFILNHFLNTFLFYSTPKDWLNSEIVKNDRPSPFFESITKTAKKKKQQLTSKNLCSTVNDWLA